MPIPNDPPEMPRREFLRRVGAAGIAVSLVGADALAAGAAAPAPATPPAMTPARPDTSAAAAPKPPSEDALALAGILQRRFPDRLTEEQWKGVTEALDQRLDSGRRLKLTKLANGDEPDATFRA